MKKLFYFLFILGIISCTNSDDILENQQISQDLEPDKAYAHYIDFPNINVSLYPSWYYTFNYENGRLIKMTGRSIYYQGIGYLFNSESYYSLIYNNNKVQVQDSQYLNTTKVYTIENSKPIQAVSYIHNFDGDEVSKTSTYTYETNKIIVYENIYNGNMEIYTTYFFDSNKNLIKSEKLEKTYGVNKRLKITNYLNFDNANNPYKKLGLINEDFYEKSLSTNNYRKIESTSQHFPNPYNGNIQLPPGYEIANLTYKYDSNGQVLLYHPL